jgi:hypothetical protein
MHIPGLATRGWPVKHVGCINTATEGPQMSANVAAEPVVMRPMCIIDEGFAPGRTMHHVPRITCRGFDRSNRNMTGFGMYDSQTRHMMNLELARIIQADREREIESELRTRRLLRNDAASDVRGPKAADRRPVQRPASTGAASR